ncbi:hypothetical protein NOR51B_1241 [Luminiphilus syltensis NOR5-1B]|uniref:Uncharacterized protein n=1 Tax=Luminiphilus syltensis NOR5-1B TaxID=565045 RepID=B8KVL3_9GAMM|nr:hypothetical protein [Luminiphilus syltensis]EED35296.1 hypothetical protein NOR51B_1241 [Luminiphilus syltensis NOR5-1B]
MELKFLESAKKDWVLNDAEAAASVAFLSTVDALRYMREGELPHALHFAGEALEAARSVLFDHNVARPTDVDRYARAAALLCKILTARGMDELVEPFAGNFAADCEALIQSGVSPRLVVPFIERIVESDSGSFDDTPTSHNYGFTLTLRDNAQVH